METKKIIDWMVLFIGIVFFSAAVYRIFNYGVGINEFNLLKIPIIFLPFTILLELILGILFILNKKIFYASWIAIIFLSISIVVAFISNFRNIIKAIPELFVFNPNPTDILLHLLYLLLLFIILFRYRNS